MEFDNPLQARKRSLAGAPGLGRDWQVHIKPPFSYEFKFGVFLEQLVVHALFPLSLLYVLPVYGYTRARNQLFLPASCAPHLILSNILVNILMYGTPWALVVGYILHGGAYIADVSVVGTAFFVRAIVVATKYGFMDDESLDIVYYCRDVARAREVSMRMQLLTGWLNPTPRTIFIELQLAARRLGNDIAAAKFYFSERRRAYMERLARPAFVAPDEVRASGFCMSRSHVSLGLIAAALAVRAPPCISQRALLLSSISVCSFYALVISFSMRGLQLGSTYFFADPQTCVPDSITVPATPESGCATTWGNVLMTIGHVIPSYIYLNVIYYFMALATVDFHRRYFLLHQAGMLVADGTEERLDGTSAHMPSAIDVTVPSNITSWVLLRNVLQEFGKQYQLRITAYTSYALLAVIAMLIWLMYGVVAHAGMFARMSLLDVGPPLHALIIFVYFILVVVSLLVSMILQGDKANELLHVNTNCIVRHRLNIRQLQYELDRTNPDPAVERRLQVCMRLLDAARESLEIRDKVAPITVMGMRADALLLRSLVTGTITGLSAVLRMLLDG